MRAHPHGAVRRFNHKTMITIRDLKKHYGHYTACDIPSLTIRDGEIVGIVGNNGAGKTTLFKLALALAKADSGTVVSSQPNGKGHPPSQGNGVDVAKSDSWKQYTGAYLDESFLISYLTPNEYFDFIAMLSDVPRKEMQQTLDIFAPLANGEIFGSGKLIRELSSGGRQKAGIIGAFVHRPSMVVLDEPFNYLDPSSQHRLAAALSQYNKATGATLLVSSHNLAYVADTCTRLLLMERGRIIKDMPNDGDQAVSALHDYFGG